MLTGEDEARQTSCVWHFEHLVWGGSVQGQGGGALSTLSSSSRTRSPTKQRAP